MAEQLTPVEAVKAAAELGIEALIAAALPKLEEALIVKVKELIPGEQFDVFAEAAIKQVIPLLEKALLDQVEKISEKV